MHNLQGSSGYMFAAGSRLAATFAGYFACSVNQLLWGPILENLSEILLLDNPENDGQFLKICNKLIKISNIIENFLRDANFPKIFNYPAGLREK